jgi:hypothetical protein
MEPVEDCVLTGVVLSLWQGVNDFLGVLSVFSRIF